MQVGATSVVRRGVIGLAVAMSVFAGCGSSSASKPAASGAATAPSGGTQLPASAGSTTMDAAVNVALAQTVTESGVSVRVPAGWTLGAEDVTGAVVPSGPDTKVAVAQGDGNMVEVSALTAAASYDKVVTDLKASPIMKDATMADISISGRRALSIRAVQKITNKFKLMLYLDTPNGLISVIGTGSSSDGSLIEQIMATVTVG